MAKKQNVRALTPIEKPVPSEEVPLLEFKAFNKGLSVTGYIKKRSHFKNRFGNPSDMVEVFDCIAMESDDDNKFAEKYAPKSGETRTLKFFVAADLRDKLELCDIKGLIAITYDGKDEDGHHLFAVSAELASGVDDVDQVVGNRAIFFQVLSRADIHSPVYLP